MKLMDLLAQHPDWVINDGGAEFTVSDYLAEGEASAAAGDRGPEVSGVPGPAGHLPLLALEIGSAPEPVGVLFATAGGAKKALGRPRKAARGARGRAIRTERPFLRGLRTPSQRTKRGKRSSRTAGFRSLPPRLAAGSLLIGSAPGGVPG
jgi:hypothetical protein